MFNLSSFVLKTLIQMAQHERPYKVREYALGWYGKGVLSDDDMLRIEQEAPIEIVEATALESTENF